MSMRLDLRKLRYFSVVADELNFRKAAERLSITQPPLTRQIKELEATFGVLLLDRSRQGVRLTSAGEWLAQQTPALTAHLDELQQGLLRFARGSPNRLRLGMTTAIETEVFKPFEDRLQRRWPNLELITVNQTSPRLVRELRRQRLDAALVVQPTDTEGLRVVPLYSDPMVVALPEMHPLTRKPKLALRDLRDEKFFWFERYRNPAFFDHCRRIFQKYDFAPKTMPEPHDQHVVLAMVAEGRGLAFFARSFRALRRPGVRYRPLQEGDELRFGIGLALSNALPAETAATLIKEAKASFSKSRSA